MTRSSDHPIRKLLICVCHPFDQWNAPLWFSERLQSEFPQVAIVHLPDYKRMDEEIVDAEMAVAWSIRPEQIVAAKKLSWIHSPAAAVNQLLFPELVTSDIVLTNAREVHGPVVAEHVIALIFALAKKIPGSTRLQEQHVWGQQILWMNCLVSGKSQARPSGLLVLAASDAPW